MTQEQIDKEAAKSLLNRALQSDKQGCAYMLIDTAKILDESIDTNSFKSAWVELWLVSNKNRFNPSVSVTL